jgi:hypothetical protein
MKTYLVKIKSPHAPDSDERANEVREAIARAGHQVGHFNHHLELVEIGEPGRVDPGDRYHHRDTSVTVIERY